MLDFINQYWYAILTVPACAFILYDAYKGT